MANRIAGITIEIDGNASKLNDALKTVDKQISKTNKALKDVNRLLKFDPGNTELLTQKQKNLEAAISGTKSRLEELKNTQSGVEKGTDEWDALQREIIATEQELSRLQEEYRNFGSVAAQQIAVVGEKMQQAGEKIQSVGKGLSTYVTAPLAAAGGAAVKSAMGFEDAIAKLSTIADTSEETGVSMDELQAQILALSDETGIAAAEIADNVYNAISAGQDTGDAVNFVAQSSKLAAAGFAESGAALDILTTIMNAYGMSAEEVNHVSDVLINTQNLGKTTVAELSSSMGKIIPTANAANVSLEQIAAGYAIMTANGIATAESTTYMNSLLNELSKSGTTASDTIKEKTGKSFQELSADGVSLADILQILSDSADESGVSMGDMFGSAEAGKAALVLLGDDAGKFNETLASMQGAVGNTDSAFELLNTTSRKGQIALNQIKNTVIDLGGTILEMAAPAVEKIAGKIKDLTERFSKLDPAVKKNVVRVAAIAAAIGPALVGVGKLTSTVGTALTLAPKIVKGIKLVASFMNPTTIGLAAVAAFVVVVVKLWQKYGDQAKALVKSTVEKIKGDFEKMKSSIAKTNDAIKAQTAKVWGEMQTMLQGKWNNIKSAYETHGGGLKGIAAATMQGIKEYYTLGFDALNTLLGGKLTGLKNAFSAAWSDIKSMVSNAVQNIKDKVSGLSLKLPEIQLPSWDTIKTKLNDIIQKIKDLFKWDWKLPDIKLPHFNVKGGVAPYGLGGKGSFPSISIDWYKKAYQNPVMFTRPTVLATPNGNYGFGDGHGAEIVMGINKLRELVGTSQGDVTINVYGTPGMNTDELARAVEQKLVALQKRRNAVYA